MDKQSFNNLKSQGVSKDSLPGHIAHLLLVCRCVACVSLCVTLKVLIWIFSGSRIRQRNGADQGIPRVHAAHRGGGSSLNLSTNVTCSQLTIFTHLLTVQNRAALYDSAPQSGTVGGGRGRRGGGEQTLRGSRPRQGSVHGEAHSLVQVGISRDTPQDSPLKISNSTF